MTQYLEIYKILYKNKLEKQKMDDDSGKNREDQKDVIKLFIDGGKEKRALNDMSMLGKRDISSLEINDPSIHGLTMKHLIFYMENEPQFKKSKMLFKAT